MRRRVVKIEKLFFYSYLTQSDFRKPAILPGNHLYLVHVIHHMSKLQQLTDDVSKARTSFIAAASGLTVQQASFKPSENEWSIVDNVEHLYWAEMGGINGMWKALDSFKKGTPVFTGEAVHAGLNIELIIENTWKEKEQVPEVAKPRWGGPLEYWIEGLKNCQPLLQKLVNAVGEVDPEKVIYPHIISGPLNIIQRLEFLRFHLNRHEGQIGRIKSSDGYAALVA
jgi:hypothetical protein